MSDVVRVVNSGVVSDRQLPGAGGVLGDAQVVRELLPLPLPEDLAAGPIGVRVGTAGDIAFMDALQKANNKALGFMYTATLQGHLEKGHVLIAEEVGGASVSSAVAAQSGGGDASGCTQAAGGTPIPPKPVGYLIAVDRYLKRDELGVIYQMCVVPEVRRSLVAATLLKHQFERSAYGCRLYCCWCAQDLPANRFWEAMGFVPLAFRTGGGRSKTKKGGKFRGRMHIFWQKRIREGDTGDLAEGGTPYWFPSQTGGGAIGEDRIVLPIPPGTHWSDAKPVVLPEGPTSGDDAAEVKLLEDNVSRLEREKRAAAKGTRSEDREASGKPKAKPARRVVAGGLHFGPSPSVVIAKEAEAKHAAAQAAAVARELKAAKLALRREKKKFDPAQVAFARELKDRWLEQVQREPNLLAASAEKYTVRRRIEATQQRDEEAVELRRLDVA